MELQQHKAIDKVSKETLRYTPGGLKKFRKGLPTPYGVKTGIGQVASEHGATSRRNGINQKGIEKSERKSETGLRSP